MSKKSIALLLTVFLAFLLPAAANATVAAANRLYGPSAANKVRAAFEARGIL